MPKTYVLSDVLFRQTFAFPFHVQAVPRFTRVWIAEESHSSIAVHYGSQIEQRWMNEGTGYAVDAESNDSILVSLDHIQYTRKRRTVA